MILISGISGFIGRTIAVTLRRAGYEVCGITNSTEALSVEGINFPVFPMKKFSLLEVFEGNKIEHIINLAVEYDRGNASDGQMFDTNCRLPVDLYLLAEHFKCCSFIQTGSFFEKKTQLSNLFDYTQTKRDAHSYCKRLNLNTPIITMQLEHVYGPGDNTVKLLPSVLIKLLSGAKDIHLGYCDLGRDLIDVEDVALAYLAILQNYEKYANKVIEVGYGEEVNLQSAVNDMVAMLKRQAPQVQGMLRFSKKNFHNQLLHSVADTRLLCETGWAPSIPLKTGLKRLVNSVMET